MYHQFIRIMFPVILIAMLSCTEDNDNPIKQISLKYVNVSPDNNWIDIDRDNEMDIVLIDTIIEYLSGIYLRMKSIESLTPSIKLSYGTYKSWLYNDNTLSYDSIVDKTLSWERSFLINNNQNLFPTTKNTNWVGIQIVVLADTAYGWIHIDGFKFTEYALDTTFTKGLEIRIGQTESIVTD